MVKVTSISPTTFEPQQYSEGDITSIPSFDINSTFSAQGGKVESAIYDLNNNLIAYNPNAQYSSISTGGGGPELTDIVEVYPEKDVKSLEFNQGSYNILYNFINNELKSSFNSRFKIKEISSNKQEIRLTAGFLEPEELQKEVEKFFPSDFSSPSYIDFYLNFGNGNLYLANNLLFDDSNNQTSILVKLYKPLPSFVKVGGEVYPWICTLQRETVAFNVEYIQKPIPVKTTIDLKGPNFSLDLNNQAHTPTKPTSYNDLFPSDIDSSSISSPYYQLQNILDSKGVTINIDYSNFNNFIHFSSAEERVKNFFSKISLIESASSKDTIKGIVKNFDGFEQWMFYNSSSDSALTSSFPTPYPKDSSLPPFDLASTSSTVAIDWYENAIYSASLYDDDNQDALINTIPTYITEDPDSESYTKFTKMIGQHFDTLFTYIQDITTRYDGDNRLDFGISKDLVGEAIKSMGINLYSGNFTGANIISSLVGINNGNSFLPPLEDGSGGVISNYITASNLPTPIEDINKEIYKRIYHNLPLLLRQKGSIAGVRTLVNCFGIPKEILDVKEFDISYKSSTQFLPTVGNSGSISFTTKSIVLPPDGDVNQNFLSPIVRVQQDYVADDEYDRDLHYTEIGYSPQGYIDDNVNSSFVPLGDDFPTFDQFYYGGTDNTYGGTKFNNNTTLTWNTDAYIRYISFFDTSLFQMLRDFVPLRNSTATGLIIKPTIKERQRQKPAQISGNNKTYEGSVSTEKGISGSTVIRPIGVYDGRDTIYPAGGDGGAAINLNKYANSQEPDPRDQDKIVPVGYSQSLALATENLNLTLGYSGKPTSGAPSFPLIKSYKDQSQYYNGEYKQTGQRSVNYSTREFREEGTDTGLFTYNNNPQNPYKTVVDLTVEGLTMLVVNSLLEAIQEHEEEYIIYNPYFQTIYIQIDVGSPSLTQDLLTHIGDTLNFSGSDGSSYTYNIGPGTVTTYLQGPVVSYDIYPAPGTDDNAFQALTSVNLSIPFHPDSESWKRGPWNYSEYNPLINNTQGPHIGVGKYAGLRKSSYQMYPDYSPSSTTPLVPINNELITSGTARLAPIPDSNYESQWWNNSRYLGNRRTSLDFNSTTILNPPVDASFTYSSESLGFDAFNPVTESFNVKESTPIDPANTPSIPEPDCDCTSYKIYNTDSSRDLNITYTDCSVSNEISTTIPPETWLSICSCTSPSFASGTNSNDYILTNFGPCG